MIEKIIVIDTETGGLTPGENSLLSVGMVEMTISDEGVTIGSEFEVWLRSGVLKVTPEALNVNKINLLTHIAGAYEERDALNRILEFFDSVGFPTGQKVVFAGHNTKFDLDFLKYLFDSQDKNLWNQRIGHRHIDTSPIAKALYHAKIEDEDNSSSSKLFGRYEPDFMNEKDFPLHTALGDALRTAHAYKSMIELMRTI